MNLSPLRTTPGRLGLQLVVVQILLAVAGVFALRSAERSSLVEADARSNQVAVSLAAACEEAGVAAWPAAVQEFGPLLDAFGIHATFVDPHSGRLLHSVGSRPEAATLSATRSVGSPLVWLVVETRLEPDDAGVRHGRLLLAGLTALCVLCTVVLARIAGGRALRAALRVAQAADELAAGNFAHPVDLTGRDEFEPVGAALHRLLRETGPRLVHLQNLSAEQQAILESMSSGLIAIDPEQRILSLNRAAAALLGIDAGRVRGRLVQEVTRQPGLNQFIAEAIAAAGAVDGEFTMDREGRPRVLVQAVSEPLRDPGGRPAGLLIVLTDITTLRRLETLRADFAANVSHELRTPITNIKGYVETLLQVGVDDPEQTTRFLDIVRSNAQRLAAIIEDLLALTRLEQPGVRETLERTNVPVRRLAESVARHLAPAAEAKEIRLIDEVPEELSVSAMATLVEQALANLVSNAITYGPAGSTVRISARPLRGKMVEVAVTDQGPGIPAHHLSRIFERFYRVDKARSRGQGGTGLGLAIVKHIALVHGGQVDVESRVGVGSTFRLQLPRGEEDPAAAETPA